MEFIICKPDGTEVGPLKELSYIDIDCGNNNDFEIQISQKLYKEIGISDGWRIGVPGTEYGGVVNKIKSNTGSSRVTISGNTWRGMLTKKIIQPNIGEDYKTVSGNVNSILNSLICNEFDEVFVCTDESGIKFENYRFDRYVDALSGIEKMLLSKNARLNIAYNSGKENDIGYVEISAIPIRDYSDEIEYSQDGTLSYLSFSFEEFTGGVNHLICLGKGELKDRLVVHLYVQEDGTIGENQFYKGKDEIVGVYDYSSEEDVQKLTENGTEQLKKLMSYKNMDVDIYNKSLSKIRGVQDIAIGDIVGGRDFDTGIYLSKQITQKIIKVKDGKETIEYSVGKVTLNRSTANSPVEQSKNEGGASYNLIKETSDKTGLSIGKEAELSNTFDVGLETRLREKLLMEYSKYVFMKTSDGTILGTLGISNNNEVVVNWDGYNKKIGSTSVYGNKVNIVGNNINLNGSIAANGVDLDLNNRIKGGSPSFATLAEFVAYVSKNPVYTFIGRWKDTGGWCPSGGSNRWYRGFCMLQNAEGGSNNVSGFIFCQYGGTETTYVGYISGTTTLSVSWQKIPTLYQNSVWNNTVNQKLYIASSNEENYRVFLGVIESAWAFCPSKDGYLRLGSPNYRWGPIYSSSSSITTSDRNRKKNFSDLTNTHVEFFMKLQPLSFEFVDGMSGRRHIGFVSQDVEQAMNECGLSDLDFAGFCKDQKTEEVVLEDGTIQEINVEGEYIYSLRYEEFIALNTYMIQRQQSEIKMLKSEIEKIKAAIGL